MQFEVKRAVKYDARGRVAIVGPAGSGKSFTSLELAVEMAGPDGKIMAVDTEHGSLSKYADLYAFDVVEPDSYDVSLWLDYLTYAEKNGYAVMLTDSLSHYWMGKDGALEFVDMAAKRYKDNMGGWKEFRPHERAMVDRMIASPLHMICTMRTKTDYVEEVNDKGKKVRRKIGLAPVQREGLEYEFDMVAYMDDDNNFIVEKTRCPEYSKRAIRAPKGKDFKPFVNWLQGAKRETPLTVPPESRPIDTNGHAPGTPEARQAVLDRKLAEVGPQLVAPAAVSKLWDRMGTQRVTIGPVLTELFLELGQVKGSDAAMAYSKQELKKFGVKTSAELNPAQARELIWDMWKLLQEPITSPADVVTLEDVPV